MSERQNVTNLIRMIGFFAAIPSVSISLFFLIDVNEHLGHFLILGPIGIAAISAILLAPKMAAKWVPADA